jgi:hypothetical protein
MEHRIAYRFHKGDHLRYRSSLTMVLEEAGGTEVAGAASFVLRQHVIEAHDDGTFDVEIAIDTFSIEGILKDHIPPELMKQRSVLRIDPLGSTQGTENPSTLRMPIFPPHPLREGDSWRATIGSGDDVLDMTYLLRSFESEHGETVAHLASEGKAVGREGGPKTSTESSFIFSVTRGCMSAMTTVVEMQWPEGQALKMVIESRLAEYGRAQF